MCTYNPWIDFIDSGIVKRHTSPFAWSACRSPASHVRAELEGEDVVKSEIS